eukprot:450755-Pelagomonas_calceolata.AAC.6
MARLVEVILHAHAQNGNFKGGNLEYKLLQCKVKDEESTTDFHVLTATVTGNHAPGRPHSPSPVLHYRTPSSSKPSPS